MTSLPTPRADQRPPVDASPGHRHLHVVPGRPAGGLVQPARHLADVVSPSLVESLAASGPRFAAGRARGATPRWSHLVHLLSRRDRVVVAALTLGWIAAQVAFWAWWLQPERLVTWPGLVLNSAMLLYLAVLPSYFLFAVNRLREVRIDLPVPDVRVAFVVTKAPSEPWEVARTTLRAMTSQEYPHEYDVWLCDENPDEETVAWCREQGIRVATRRGVPEYQRSKWPRRAKCKEGNLAWFYDHWGYVDYDVVAQLDCDHVPNPTYLAEVVRPFADPAVGYVAAPSVCDNNADSSWSARGRLYCDASFHGPLQTGHQRGLAPMSIGSHYAVRTAAVREIGGIGPELAEDFSTSFLLTSAGWQGAFAQRAEAHGDGPLTFTAMLTQEFQWSRSLMTLLLGLVPRHLGRLSWSLRLRFVITLAFYPLLATTTFLGLGLALTAAVTGEPWVDANYIEFLARWAVVSVWVLAIAAFLRRRGLMRPIRTPLISWETWLYVLTRWPVIARGITAAVRQHIRPRPIGFLVTPKSRDGLERLPTRVQTPYLVITLALSGGALIGEATNDAAGYVFLCLLGSATYALVSLLVPVLHAREAARGVGASLLPALRQTVAVPLTLATVALVPLVTAAALYPPYAMRVFGL